MDVSKMKYNFLTLLFSGVIGLCRLEAFEELDDVQQLSFFRGYLLWQEHLEHPQMPYDLAQVIAGIQAAEKGTPFPCDKENLQVKIRKFQEELLAKQTKENLEDAETFLGKLVDENIIEVVPKKLYYEQLKIGEGRQVQFNSTPLITYTVWTYNRHGKEEIISIDEPFPITLKDTIAGFSQGVIGMQKGEIRTLYIHPDLAYGTHAKFDPNLLVIFKVEIISVEG